MTESEERRAMKMTEFREKYKLEVQEKAFNLRKRCQCNRAKVVTSLKSLFPFYEIMKNYNWKSDFISDVIAGTTVGILQLPQGLYL